MVKQLSGVVAQLSNNKQFLQSHEKRRRKNEVKQLILILVISMILFTLPMYICISVIIDLE